jgi:hypothetical protein
MGTQLVDLPLTSSLTDLKGNLTAGGLIRNSDATYVNTAGALAYSRGTRTNLWTRSDPADNTGVSADVANVSYAAYSWPAAPSAGLSRAIVFGDNSAQRTFGYDIAVTINTSYILSFYIIMDDGSAPSIGTSMATGDFALRVNGGQLIGGSATLITSLATPSAVSIGSGVYRVTGVYTPLATTTAFVGIRKYTGSSAKGFKVSGFQLEALPSGNVIGPDLMDQEGLGAELIDFSSEAGWTDAGSVWTVSGGTASHSGAGGLLTRTLTTIGKVYKYSFTSTITSGICGLSGGVIVGGYYPSAGTYTGYYIATSDQFALYADGTSSVSAVSLKEVTSPAKGSFHGTAMLAGSTELAPANNATSSTEANATTGWTNAGFVTFESSSTSPYLGSYSLHFTANGDAQYAYTSFSGTSGKLYKISFYAKVPNAAAPTYCNFRVGTTNGGNEVLASQVINATTWTAYKFYVVAPSTATLYPNFYEGGGNNNADIWIDYFSVRQVQTAWTRYGTNTMEIDEAEGSGGALKVTRVDNDSIAQLVLSNSADGSADLVVGETYQVTFKVKASGGTIWYSVEGASTLVSLSSTDATLIAKTFYFKATNATTNYLYIYATAGIAWIDDLTIRSVPDLAYLSPGTYTATAGSTATIPAEPRFESNGLLVEGEGTNLYEYSELDTGYTKTQTTFGDFTWPSSVSFTKAFTVGDNSVQRYVYKPIIFPTAAIYTVSIFVYMDDLAGPPVLGAGAGKDFSLLIQGTGATAYNSVVSLGSGVYRISGYRNSTASGPSSTGLDKSTSNTARTFKVIGFQLEATAYPTSYIPTNGCPVTRLSEAGSASNGYSWTMSTALKNSLGAASPSRGTMLVDFYQPMTETSFSGIRNVISITNDPASILYFNTTIKGVTYDGSTTCNFNGLTMTSNLLNTFAVRWDKTADGGNGYLQIANKINGVWTTTTTDTKRVAYDGSFTLGTSFRLAYGNEYPFWIKNIKFFDGWVADADLDNPWKTIILPICKGLTYLKKKVRNYAY